MFDLIRRTPLKEYNGEGLFYVHEGTGMEVFHIKNDDPELTCSFTFSTPSEDDKGVAHILEHTVLCGSKRYPVKDPFNVIQQSSPNTFLNAVTFGDKTMYPFSSPIKKDFDNLFDVYADSVFAPLLRKNSFYQEGIRLFDGKPDGVVYNEMCGARDTEDSILQLALNKAFFEGTPYAYDSGGNPLSIITLSYEEYLKRYKKWYSPTNCRMFLFGNLDAQEYLDKLEERYLNKAQKGEKIIPYSENYLPKLSKNQIKPQYQVYGCPSQEASSVVVNWLTVPSSDPVEMLTLSVLVDVLLGNTGAPLYKAIVESDLGEDLNPMSGTSPDSPLLPFTVGFTGAKPEKAKEIEAFILDTLTKLVKNGLPKENVAAVLKRMEFKLQEIPEGATPVGISACIKADRYWHRGKNPEDGIRDFKRLEILKEKMKSGHYLEDWLQKNILDNPNRLLLSVVYDPDYNQKAKAEEERILSQIKLPSEEEKQDFENFVNTPNSPEALDSIGHITRDDIPPSPKMVRHKHYKSEKGAQLYVLPLFTRSIVLLKMYFDVRNLTEEEHLLVPILIRLLNMCGTKSHSYDEFETYIRMCTGGFGIDFNNGRTAYTYKPLSGVSLGTRCLRSELPKVLALIDELLFEADTKDLSRIKAVLTDLIMDFRNNYAYSASSYAALNAASALSATARESEYNLGTQYWFYLEELKKKTDKSLKAMKTLSEGLTNLYKKLFTQKRLMVHITSEEPTKECSQLVLQHINKYPEGKFVRVSNYYKKYQKKPEEEVKLTRCFELSSGPAFNVLTIGLAGFSEREIVTAQLLGDLMTSGYLWQTVRAQNGAYGVACSFDELEQMMAFSSYRDPCIEKTLQAFLKALDSEFTEEEVEHNIVMMLCREIRPQYPKMYSQMCFKMKQANSSWKRHLRRREILRTLTKEDFKAVAQKIKARSEKQLVKVTVCGREMLQSQEPKVEFMEHITLPI